MRLAVAHKLRGAARPPTPLIGDLAVPQKQQPPTLHVENCATAPADFVRSSSFDELLIELAKEHERQIQEVREKLVYLHHGQANGGGHRKPDDVHDWWRPSTTPRLTPRSQEVERHKISGKQEFGRTWATSDDKAAFSPEASHTFACQDDAFEQTAPFPKEEFFPKAEFKKEAVDFDDEDDDFVRTSMIFGGCVRRVEDMYDAFNNIQEPPRHGLLSRIVSSQKFGSLTMVVIFADSIFNAYSSEREIRTLDTASVDRVVVAETLFLIFYILELLVKLLVHRGYFFCNNEMAWNIFDFVLVLQAIVDNVLRVLEADIDSASMTFVRVVRLLKLGKIIRMFRALRFLRELRVMVLTIIGSLVSVVWSLIALVLILYIFSLVCIQTMSAHIMDNADHMDRDTLEGIRRYFGSMPKAMLTLYMCTNGGVDWYIIYDLIKQTGVLTEIAFVFFLSFFNFAVLNILSGIFLETTLRNSQPDREGQALEKRRRDREDAQALRELFHSMDKEGQGMLSMETLEMHMNDAKVRAYLSSIGIDVRDAKMFFEVLTQVSGTSIMTIEDFVELCSRMKGQATATDMASLSFEVKLLRREMQETLCAKRVAARAAAPALPAIPGSLAGPGDAREHRPPTLLCSGRPPTGGGSPKLAWA